MFTKMSSRMLLAVVLAAVVLGAGCFSDIVEPVAQQGDASDGHQNPAGSGSTVRMIPIVPIPPPPPLKPDYVVVSIVPVAADYSIVRVQVKNQGKKAATSSTVTRVQWHWSECQGPNTVDVSTPPLGIGQTVTLTVYRSPIGPLPAYISATADFTGAVPELYEGNNRLEVRGPGGFLVC